MLSNHFRFRSLLGLYHTKPSVAESGIFRDNFVERPLFDLTGFMIIENIVIYDLLSNMCMQYDLFST